MFIIYLFGNKNKEIYKIGFCKKSKGSEKRLQEVQTGCPYKLEVLNQFETKYGSKLEKSIHRKFQLNKVDHIDGEELTGEWFHLSKQELDEFTQICQKTQENFDSLVENSTFENTEKMLK